MEPRVIIVVAALALFVVILIGFLVAVVRSVRKHEEELEPVQTLGDWPALPPAPERIVDTNLDGLELDIPVDSPSSRLLAPLRVGAWQPPVEPAPGARLGEVSLAQRIASFQPPPVTPREPRFAPTLPPQAPWPRTAPAQSAPVTARSVLAVGLAAAASGSPPEVVPAMPAQPAALPSVAALLPQAAIPAASYPVVGEVRQAPAGRPSAAERGLASTSPEPVVEQSAEQTGVLPPLTSEPPAPELSPPEIAPVGTAVVGLGVAEVTGAVDEATVHAASPRPGIAAPEVIQSAPAVESAMPAVVTAVPVVEAAVLPVAGLVSPGRAGEKPSVAATVEQPLVPVPAPAAQPPAAPAPAVMEPVAAEQPTAELTPVPGAILTPTPAQPTPERPRPAAVIHAPRPEVDEVPEPPRAETSRPRPRTHVRGNLDSVLPVEYESAVQPSPLKTPLQRAVSRSQAPDLIMVAPVEIWFGDARVGVKAGTRTYAQFRKYADVLLDGLKGT